MACKNGRLINYVIMKFCNFFDLLKKSWLSCVFKLGLVTDMKSLINEFLTVVNLFLPLAIKRSTIQTYRIEDLLVLF